MTVSRSPSPGSDRVVMVLLRSQLPSLVRQDSAPEREPHIPAGCLVVLTRRYDDQPGGTMTTSVPATPFTDPVPAQRLERAAAALTEKNFAVEILDDAAA